MRAGSHIGKITRTTLGWTKKHGTQLAVSLVNKDGDRCVKYLHFTRDAGKYSVEQVKACGFEGHDISALHNTDIVVGNKVEFDVTIDPADETQIDVGWLNPVGGTPVLKQEMTANEAREAGQELAHFFTREKPKANDIDDYNLDDIPF
jgi:hypothetical protein